METIRGKTSLCVEGYEFRDRLARYTYAALDLGTGDGRFVRSLAERHPDRFVVGVDACRENLQEHSRAKLPNMLFVIASAQQLPFEFEGLFVQVTVNFPWGSLLQGLLAGDPRLMQGLAFVSRPNARIRIHLNGDALMESGASLDTGANIINENLSRYGWRLKEPHPVGREALSQFSSTWARRLAHGRDPHAIMLHGRRA